MLRMPLYIRQPGRLKKGLQKTTGKDFLYVSVEES